MEKWADYLISAVSYENHLIHVVVRHADTDTGITDGEAVDRTTISSDMKKGLEYYTMYSGKDTWRRGSKIRLFSMGGEMYLRADSNRAKMDNLGDLPSINMESPGPKELEHKPDAPGQKTR